MVAKRTRVTRNEKERRREATVKELDALRKERDETLRALEEAKNKEKEGVSSPEEFEAIAKHQQQEKEQQDKLLELEKAVTDIDNMDVDDDEPVASTPQNDTDADPEGVLYSLEKAQEDTGATMFGKIVAWTERGYSKPVIVQYGPKNAAMYLRSTAAREMDTLKEDDTPRFGPDHRRGDEKLKKKFIRKLGQFKGIEGVTDVGDIEKLKPKTDKERDDAKTNNTRLRQFPIQDLLVRWDIDGKIEKTWEVRSSIKHLWPNATKCDEYIYYATKYHQNRHQEWKNNERKGYEKSPTPIPNDYQQQRQENSAENRDDTRKSPTPLLGNNQERLAGTLTPVPEFKVEDASG